MVLSPLRLLIAIAMVGAMAACTPVRATVKGAKAATKVATAPVKAVF